MGAPPMRLRSVEGAQGRGAHATIYGSASSSAYLDRQTSGRVGPVNRLSAVQRHLHVRRAAVTFDGDRLAAPRAPELGGAFAVTRIDAHAQRRTVGDLEEVEGQLIRRAPLRLLLVAARRDDRVLTHEQRHVHEVERLAVALPAVDRLVGPYVRPLH